MILDFLYAKYNGFTVILWHSPIGRMLKVRETSNTDAVFCTCIAPALPGIGWFLLMVCSFKVQLTLACWWRSVCVCWWCAVHCAVWTGPHGSYAVRAKAAWRETGRVGCVRVRRGSGGRDIAVRAVQCGAGWMDVECGIWGWDREGSPRQTDWPKCCQKVAQGEKKSLERCCVCQEANAAGRKFLCAGEENR